MAANPEEGDAGSRGAARCGSDRSLFSFADKGNDDVNVCLSRQRARAMAAHPAYQEASSCSDTESTRSGRGTLADVLAAISGAPLKAVDRKAAVRHAVGVSLGEPGGGHSEPCTTFDPVAEIQEVHEAVRAAGLPASSAKELRDSLRGLGEEGHGVAAAVDKLRKHRNLASHPRVGLAQHVGALVAKASAAPSSLAAVVATLVTRVSALERRVDGIPADMEVLAQEAEHVAAAVSRELHGELWRYLPQLTRRV